MELKLIPIHSTTKKLSLVLGGRDFSWVVKAFLVISEIVRGNLASVMKKHNLNMYIVSKVKCGGYLIVNENMGVGKSPFKTAPPALCW